MDESKVSIRVELEGEILDRFNEIKLTRFIEQNTEAIRYCIVETANSSSFDLDQRQIDHIKSVIKLPQLQKKRGIYSIQDFVSQAVTSFLNSLTSEIESIQSFEVRKQLTDKENELALSIIELQSTKVTEMFTLEELMEYTNSRNRDEIYNKLEKFTNDLILSKQIISGTVYYHANK